MAIHLQNNAIIIKLVEAQSTTAQTGTGKRFTKGELFSKWICDGTRTGILKQLFPQLTPASTLHIDGVSITTCVYAR
jgi:hypothetical protein